VLDEGRLVDMDDVRIDRVLRPKIIGARVLDEVTRAQALDFFVVCSSLAGLAAPAGQGVYAAANACLDAFAGQRARAGGSGRSLAIDWAPWRDTGMVAQPGDQQALTARSIAVLTNEEGIAGLAAALALDGARLAYFRPGDVQLGIELTRAPSTAELASRVRIEVEHLESLWRSPSHMTLRTTRAQLARDLARAALTELRIDVDGAIRSEAADLRAVDARHRRYAVCLLAHLQAGPGAPSVSVDAAVARHPEHAGMLRLLAHVGEHLADVLRGARAPLEVLFPHGRIDLLRGAYAEDADMSALQRLVARLVEEDAGTSVRPLNVIEVGAGTGSTLCSVVERLKERPFKYVATDVSRFFLDRLRATVPASTPLATKVLDIALPPASQGYELHTFDVAIAVSVLHATPDLRATLANMRSLLTDDGLLVLVEPTTAHIALDLIFGMTPGWWSFADADLRRDSPLLPAARWRTLLEQEGFVDVRSLPADDREYEQIVLLARAPLENVRSAGVNHVSSPAPTPPERRGGAAVSPIDPAVDVAGIVNSALAVSLGIEPETIDSTRALMDLGLDSLMAVDVASTLSRALGFRVAPLTLFEYPTAQELANHLASRRGPSGTALTVATRSQPSMRGGSDRAIAVIGLACRFPGAPDEQSFWQLLRDGRDAVVEVPPERWRWQDGSAELRAARWGGFLDGIDLFDPLFFDISPREARVMDPQQRLLLETAWVALESAGYAGAATNGSRVGVFVGCSQNGYLQRISPYLTPSDVAAGIGNQNAIIPNRLSYCLNLRGPSVLVDTLCSSSLTSVHLACRSLRQGECEMALAGGANVLLSPDYYRGLVRMNALARDGRCKAFDARADGFVSGEGMGIVVLKALERALADGDTIHGIVLGSAMNHDGRSNGLTAPNPTAQCELLRSAWADAGVTAGELSYIEAHGTGTPLGDPIEVEGLTRAFRADTNRSRICALGSVKTNIGHLESAAGIAGLIKVLLAMRHGAIPPTLHFQEPNPQIQFDATPFFVNTTLMPWQAPGPYRAGISSFGMGGTNVHVVVQQAPTEQRLAAAGTHPRWFPVSARSQTALATALENLADFLRVNPATPLSDIAYTLAVGRAEFSYRAAVLADDVDHTHERLRRASTLVRAGESGTPEILRGLAAGDRDRTEVSPDDPARAAAEFVRGARVSWNRTFRGAFARIPLPTYPFERRRCWVDEPSLNPLLGRRVG
jgi:polyketide synthase PksM